MGVSVGCPIVFSITWSQYRTVLSPATPIQPLSFPHILGALVPLFLASYAADSLRKEQGTPTLFPLLYAIQSYL